MSHAFTQHTCSIQFRILFHCIHLLSYFFLLHVLFHLVLLGSCFSFRTLCLVLSYVSYHCQKNINCKRICCTCETRSLGERNAFTRRVKCVSATCHTGLLYTLRLVGTVHVHVHYVQYFYTSKSHSDPCVLKGVNKV